MVTSSVAEKRSHEGSLNHDRKYVQQDTAMGA